MRKPSRHVVNTFSCAENAFITIRTGFTPPWLHAEIPHLSAMTFASSETCVFSDRVLMSALTCTPAAGFITACHTCACRLLSHLSFLTVRWASLQSERRGSVVKQSMGGRSDDAEPGCIACAFLGFSVPHMLILYVFVESCWFLKMLHSSMSCLPRMNITGSSPM